MGDLDKMPVVDSIIRKYYQDWNESTQKLNEEERISIIEKEIKNITKHSINSTHGKSENYSFLLN